MTKKNHKITLLYDGACALCAFEMDLYRKKDPKGLIKMVDISLPSFSVDDYGLEEKAVNKHFHALDEAGQWHKGVDAFILIWKTLGIYAPLSYMASNPVSRPLFLAGYRVFAEIRPYLPGRKDCTDGSCEVKLD